MVREYNAQTGEIIARELTAEEIERASLDIPSEATLEDRIAELESALDALLSGRTN